jgi:hypothetical protein
MSIICSLSLEGLIVWERCSQLAYLSASPPTLKGKEPTLHARFKDTFLTILYVIVDDLCQPHASQLPESSKFNPLVRFYDEDIEQIAVKLGVMLEGEAHPYQALDSSAMPVRDAKRRAHGWLAG